MGDTTENSSSVVVQAAKVDVVARFLSVGQFALGVLAICLTIAASIGGGVNTINASIAELKHSDTEQSQQIVTINDKMRGYDALILQRNEQYMRTGERLARIEALLGQIASNSRNTEGR